MSIAVVRHGAASSMGATGFTSPAFDTTGASLIVVAFNWLTNAISPGHISPTLTDSKGNIYRTLTIQSAAAGGTGIATVLALASNSVVGTGHTFTLTNDNAFFGSLFFLALSGASIHLPFDQQNGAIDGAHASGGGFNTGSVTPSVDNEIVITGIVADDTSGGTLSIDNGFTKSDELAYSFGNNFGAAMAYKIQTTAGAVNPKWTIDSPSGWNPAAAVIATFSTSPIALPTPVLPTPDVTGSLAIYYATQDTTRFYLNNLTHEKMVYQVFTVMKDGPFPPGTPRAGAVVGTTLLETIALLKSQLGSDCLIGTYNSPFVLDDTADTQDGYQTNDPIARIPGPGLAGTVFTADECLDFTSGPFAGQKIHPWCLDFMNPTARAKWLSAFDDQLLARQDLAAMQVIETDNWIFTEISSPDSPYPIGKDDVLDWFDDVHDLIHSRGYLHAPNFGFWASGFACSDADILRVASKAEMVFYENGVQHTYLNNPTNIAEWVRRTLLALNAGCRPLFSGISSDHPPNYDNSNFVADYISETEFLCGLAMILGIHPYVGYAWFLPREDFPFYLWPQLYGAPTGPLVNAGMSIYRQFGSVYIRASFTPRSISITNTIPTTPLTSTPSDSATIGSYSGDAKVIVAS